ncbi:MAG: 7-carboxy-7-deazaguanine synthase QueE [Candidatus Margulisbacteria bacterium]|nr:7-carboxy-7-deazaguanine synthase QueE [Candidatus Margulisiibacteriota bacterium]
MSGPGAQICEIFNSIQGEGLYVGQRQTFVRFASCNLNCQYCDSPKALQISKEFTVESTPGKKNFNKLPNPAAIDQLIEIITSFEKPKGVNHSISLTGGEPLLQVDFLKEFIPELKKKVDLPIYLETNGVLPDHLTEIIELIDIVALDLKLPSATGLYPYWNEHKKALETAYTQEVFVKVIFTKETRVKEMDEAVTLIAGIDENIPLVLQPVTPHGPIKHRPTAEQIMAFHTLSKRKLKDVRVIPQVHKLFGVL